MFYQSLNKIGFAPFAVFMAASGLVLAVMTGNTVGWVLNVSCGISVTAAFAHRRIRGLSSRRSPRTPNPSDAPIEPHRETL